MVDRTPSSTRRLTSNAPCWCHVCCVTCPMLILPPPSLVSTQPRTCRLKCRQTADIITCAQAFEYDTSHPHTMSMLLHHHCITCTYVDRTRLDCSPIMIAPTGFHRLAHVDGEMAVARAAREAGVIFTYNYAFSTVCGVM